MLTSETGTTPGAENSAKSARKSPQLILQRPAADTHVNPLEKIEQLLTCSICLDRYKIPKLLPCQHTYCLPCLDSYADTIHHNLKCPECRAEHSIPYDGAKGFPTNLTLAGFLDIHLEATNDTSEQIEAYIHRYNMERCKICDEKSELEVCHHCDRKACKECRKAHMEMLKRDLGRLLNQVRRLSNRIKEASEGVGKGLDQLDSNAESTKTEIHEYFQRYANELKRREQHWISEVEVFRQNEKRLMESIRNVLQVESTNLGDACAWVESALSGGLEVKDEELCRYKTVFVDGIEYLRNFQPDSEDLFSKKIRFSPGDDAAKLPTAISNFGELTVSLPQFAGRFLPLEQQYLPRPIRMGLESDSYRTSFRSNLEETRSANKYRRILDNEVSPFRRRQPPISVEADDDAGGGRLNRLRVGNESGRSSPLNVSPAASNGGSSWRSAYLNSTAPQHTNPPETASILTELDEPAANTGVNKSTAQLREDLQSRRSNAADSSKRTSLVLPSVEPIRSEPARNERTGPTSDKLADGKTNKVETRTSSNNTVVRLRNKPPLPRPESSTVELAVRPPSTVEAARRRSLIIETISSTPASDSANPPTAEVNVEAGTPTRRQKFKIICRSSLTQRNSSLKRTDSADSLRCTPTERITSGLLNGEQKRTVESTGNVVTGVSSSTITSSTGLPTSSVLSTKADVSVSRRLFGTSATSGLSNGSTTSSTVLANSAETPPLTPTSRATWVERRRQRFLRSRTNPEIFTSFEKSTVGHRTAADSPTPPPSAAALSSRVQLLLQELQLKNAFVDNSTTPRHANATTTDGNGLNESGAGRRSRYESGSSSGTAATRRLSAVSGERDSTEQRARTRLARQSSGGLLLASTIDYGSKSKPRLVFGRRGDNPSEFNWPRGLTALSGGEFAVSDSSNHRIQIFNNNGRLLRTIGSYGSGDGQLDSCAAVCYNREKRQLIVSDRYNHRITIFDVVDGRFVRSFGGPEASKAQGQFNNPWGVAIDDENSIYVVDKDNHRVQIFDHQFNFKSSFGSKGDGIGQFNHPLFIAVHRRTQNIFVSDSNNHRVCVFDHGNVAIFCFGVEGFHPAHLKLPRGIAVDEQGYVVVADSGNNRVQVFTSSGDFVHGFGTWGSSPGQFKGIEGVALVDGQIVVTDRENHRVQAF